MKRGVITGLILGFIMVLIVSQFISSVVVAGLSGWSIGVAILKALRWLSRLMG